MAKTIPQLTLASAVTNADEFIVEQSGVTKRASLATMRLAPIVEVSQSRSFTNDDTGKIFHFDTTSNSLNATFTGSALSNGFNATIVNTGTNAVTIVAPGGLNSIGTAVSEQYASAFVYALNGTIFATGRLV